MHNLLVSENAMLRLISLDLPNAKQTIQNSPEILPNFKPKRVTIITLRRDFWPASTVGFGESSQRPTETSARYPADCVSGDIEKPA